MRLPCVCSLAWSPVRWANNSRRHASGACSLPSCRRVRCRPARRRRRILPFARVYRLDEGRNRSACRPPQRGLVPQRTSTTDTPRPAHRSGPPVPRGRCLGLSSLHSSARRQPHREASREHVTDTSIAPPPDPRAQELSWPMLPLSAWPLFKLGRCPGSVISSGDHPSST